MMKYALIFLGIAAVGGWCALYFPFWKKRRPLLTVLRFGKIGSGKGYISPQALEKRLNALQKWGFTPIVPEDLLAAKQGVQLPPRPVLLVFEYGLESFYKTVFPLLKARGQKACVCLCADYIGQYNAWQDPYKDPWQNTLTAEELAQLQKSGLISFAAHGLTYADLNALPQETAAAQAREARYRLQHTYQLTVNTFFYPQSVPSKELDKQIAAAGYAVRLSRSRGTNLLPARLETPLHTVCGGLNLLRLRAKLTRG